MILPCEIGQQRGKPVLGQSKKGFVVPQGVVGIKGNGGQASGGLWFVSVALYAAPPFHRGRRHYIEASYSNAFPTEPELRSDREPHYDVGQGKP